MGNHCIDLVCLDCGRSWCARGCEPTKPNIARALKYIQRQVEWCERWNMPFTMGVKSETDTCKCGSKEVYLE